MAKPRIKMNLIKQWQNLKAVNMICDNLENLSKYSEISKKTADFLISLNAETPAGHYEIDEYIYANVDIYDTKLAENCRFEAHKKYIDIQMLLDGSERLDCISPAALKINESYNEEKDIMFFENPENLPDASFILKPERFVMIYPHEAHRPQMALEGVPQKVKKAVVKIHV